MNLDSSSGSMAHPGHMGPGRSEIFPIDIDSVEVGLLGIDLYIDIAHENRLVLYRTVGVEFTESHRAKLREQGVKFLYVPTNQHRAYRRMLVDKLDHVYHDESVSRAERSRLVRASCSKMIEDAMLFPERRVPFATISEVSSSFARWASEDHSQFSQLIDLAEHDYYTAMHMVNVGVGCGLLTQAMAPGDVRLLESTIRGGLLHDVGKRSIPEDVLNKEGRLDAAEWELIQTHPAVGTDLLRQHTRSPRVVVQIVGMHHERLDGSGYPAGLRRGKIPVPVRICAAVDVFDAICSARPYRGATPPGEALRILQEGSGSFFDSAVVAQWGRIVEQVCTDRNHVVMHHGDALQAVLPDFLEQPPVPCNLWQVHRAPHSGKERRHHPRYRVNGQLKSRFVRQGKDYPIACGEWVDLQCNDVSRGGLQLATPWPLAVNDMMEFWLPTVGGGKALRLAVVVRVRQDRNCQWVAGLMFVRQEVSSEDT